MSIYPTWLTTTLISLGFVSLFNDINDELIVVLLPMFITSLVGASQAPFIVGILASVSDAITSISRLFFGVISDLSLRKKIFIRSGYTISAISAALLSFVNSVGQVWFLRSLSSLGKGMREAPRDALIAKITPPFRYGTAFGFHRAMDTLGGILGPLILFFMPSTLSFRALFLIASIPSFIAVLILMKTTITDEKSVIVATIDDNYNYYTLFRLFPRAFWVFWLISLLFSCAYYTRLLLVLRVELLFSGQDILVSSGVAHTTLFYVLFNLIRFGAELSSGRLSDRFSAYTVLALGGYSLFGCASLALMLNNYPWLTALIAFVLGGFAAGTVKVVTRACAAHLLPDVVKSTGFGLIQLTEGVGAVIAGTLVGLLWQKYSATYAFGYAAFVSFLSAFVLLLVAYYYSAHGSTRSTSVHQNVH